MLARRAGGPTALALVFAEVAARAGAPLVGLGAPGRVLLAPPADAEGVGFEGFGVDARGGRVLRGGELATFAAESAGAPLGALVAAGPLSARAWAARVLSGLRAVYARDGDDVRLLGAAERLRLLARAEPGVVSRDDQHACAFDLARCVVALGDDARRSEARALLRETQRSLELEYTEPAEYPIATAFLSRVEGLLADRWLKEGDFLGPPPT